MVEDAPIEWRGDRLQRGGMGEGLEPVSVVPRAQALLTFCLYPPTIRGRIVCVRLSGHLGIESDGNVTITPVTFVDFVVAGFTARLQHSRHAVGKDSFYNFFLSSQEI